MSAHGPRVAANSLANMAGRMSSLLFWLIFTPYILRELGPDRFGLWSLMFTFTSYMLIMDLGVGSALSRFAADFKARGHLRELRALVSTASMVYLVLTVVALIFAAACGPWLLKALRVPDTIAEARPALLLAAAGGGVIAFASIMNGLLAGFEEQVLMNSIALAGLVPWAILLGAALATHSGLLGILAAQYTGTLLVGLTLAWFVRKRFAEGGMPRPRWDGAAARQLTGFGLWVQVSAIVSVTQLQLVKIFLSRWVGLPMVGSYELGFRVANGIMAIPGLAFAAMVPTAAGLAARGDRERLAALHLRGMRWVCALGLPLAAAIWSAAPWLLRGWLVTVPEGAVPAARTVTLCLAIAMLSGTGTAIMTGSGRPYVETIAAAIALSVQVALLFALTPSMGFRGALLAQVLGVSSFLLLFTIAFHRIQGWSWSRLWLAPLLRPLGVSLAIAAAGVAANPWLLARVQPGRLSDLGIGAVLLGLGAGLGFVALLALGQLEPADRELLRALPGRARAVLAGGRRG